MELLICGMHTETLYRELLSFLRRGVMDIYVEEQGGVNALVSLLLSLKKDGRVKSVLIFAGDGSGFLCPEIEVLLKDYPKTVWGGIFPAIIHRGAMMTQGVIIMGLHVDVNTLIVENVEECGSGLFSKLLTWSASLGHEDFLMPFCDARGSGMDQLAEALLAVFGLGRKCLGGGTGSLAFGGQPSVITNRGILSGGAVVAAVLAEIGVCARHGWHAEEGPFTASKASGNRLMELNGKPAFSVYKDVVERLSGKRFGIEPFFEIAKAYPLGIASHYSEHLIRDPLAIEADRETMILAGGLAEGVEVDVLSGNNRALIHAAQSAMRTAMRRLSGDSPTVLLALDCISRALHMGDSFAVELSAVAEECGKVIGACSIGEFASDGTDHLRLFNKTAVLGALRLGNPEC